MRPADGTVAARLDFLIVGAQKCAITWLYDCLAEHPELALPKHKLEDAHLGGDLHRLHADEWLFDHFHSTPDNRIRGHVSVEHPAEARSPAEVHRLLPDVRLIVSLRDPEDRAVSAFHWYVRKGKRPPMALDIALDAALHALEDDDPAHAPLRDLLEHMVHLQAPRVARREIGEGVGEDHVLRGPVAEDQGGA